MNRTTKIKITELNPHVICVLCGGYYINATTITECLHSFCRTCITRYLETSKYCPVCDVMVHKTRPLDYIRSDKTLQDLVYKLVPGLYKTEMKRRREYYAEADPAGVTVSQLPSEDRGDEFHDRIIYTEDEKISLSLELCAEGVPFKTPLRIHGHNGPDNIRIRDVRYLQCPAAFSIGNLKKFIRMKFDLKLKFEIDIFHTAEPLPDYYSLMDIAYIYTWTRRAPLRLFYTVFERKLPPKAPDPVARAQPVSAQDSTTQVENSSQGTTNTPKPEDISLGRKRKLLEGPDDISPDLAFDKSKRYKTGRRKGICTPKKRAKKAIVEVDESVQEALSESEEHLAKLSLLDCSGEVRREKIGAHGNGKRNEIADSDSIANGAMSDATDVYTEDGNTNDGMGIESVNGDKGEIGDITVTTSDNVVGDIDNGAKQDKNESGDNSKMSSAQVSPGSGSSITLSLFQPLNLVEPDSECKKASDKDGKQTDAKDGKLYEFDNEEMDNTAAKKPRGRPKGSKNKAPSEKSNKTKQKKVDQSNDSEKDYSSNLVASKKLPRLKPPQPKKKGPVEEHMDSPTKDNTEKPKSSTPADKTSGKNVTDSGEVTKAKRKYVRKTKADASVESNQDVKRAKTDNVEQKETSQTKGKLEQDGKHENSNVQTDSVVKKTSVQHESNNTLSVNRDTSATEKEQTVSQKKTNKEMSEQIVQEQQVIVNSSSLQEPITPLYGETPKMNESNQGLPCSPNMDSIENGGRLVIDIGEPTDDPNGAKTNNLNDRGVKCNKAQTNGSIMASMQNGNFVSSCTFTKEIFRNSVGGEQNCGINLSKSQEIPVAHSDQYRLSMSGFSSPGLLDMMSGFSPPPITAHARMGHVTGNTGVYQSHDQNFDQPLDLTNGNNRDEYTKGKIFKTKMLKKSFPKSDNQQKF